MVALHVVAAVVGFGAVGLSGVYATTARHLERPGALEEAVRFFRARATAEWAVAAVPLLGAAAVVVDPAGHGHGAAGVGALDRLWVAVALLLWAVAAGAAWWVARPARAALRAALPAGDALPAGADAALPAGAGAGPQGGIRREEVRVAATRLAVAAAVCDVAFALAVIDMVIRP